MSEASVLRCAVRPGSYYDSVVLMQLQRSLAALPGIFDAGVVMATPPNREMLAASGLLPEASETGAQAGEGDLLIAVKAEDETAAGEALSRVDALLQVRRSGGGQGGFRPRSLQGAVQALPGARWTLISVPGRHAAGVAEQALDLGLNVFLYSDNVPLAEEAALKRNAAARGLLVMGPDCGTAVIGGAGLGFANRVRRGSVGIVAASGTGLQIVASRVHELGGGISQAIGTGGRDLAEPVGGITARQALDLLGRDPETETIVLLSKPPSPAVAARVLAAARATGKPAVVNFLGWTPPVRRLGNIRFAVSLEEAAELAVGPHPPAPSPIALPTPGRGGEQQEKQNLFSLERRGRWRPSPGGWESDGRGDGGEVRGLFSGGTLAAEVRLTLQALLRPEVCTILDLGDDEFTVGRLHPMIDQDLRLRRLRAEAADPAVSVLLLDVVLGDGAHADPAGELAPVIERCLGERTDLAVLVLMVGTDQDPQNLDEQIATLERAGAQVLRTVSALVEEVWDRLAPIAEPTAPVPLEVLDPPAVINVGLESFYDSLASRGVPSVHVEWKPPAGGNEKLAGILARMKNR
jgi:FdrA protein